MTGHESGEQALDETDVLTAAMLVAERSWRRSEMIGSITTLDGIQDAHDTYQLARAAYVEHMIERGLPQDAVNEAMARVHDVTELKYHIRREQRGY